MEFEIIKEEFCIDYSEICCKSYCILDILYNNFILEQQDYNFKKRLENYFIGFDLDINQFEPEFNNLYFIAKQYYKEIRCIKDE